MSWLSSIIIGVLTAVVAAIVGGTIAALAVDWYKVPSREGASGYFVLLFILLAIIVGFILGMVVSRTVGARPDPSFLKALGISQLIVLGVTGVIGGVARLLADVSPTLGGKELIVNVEFRWPKGQEPPAAKEQWWLELASVSSHVQRNSEDGPVWREDARLEDGYWIVPGAVNLYTSRGDRTLTLRPDSIFPYGYVANIPAWPRRGSLEWSEWYPKQRKGDPPLPDEFRYRWRLVQAGQPIRTQRFGDFEVTLLAESVGGVTYQGGPRMWTAYGSFTVRYKGKPLSIPGRTIEGDPPKSYDQAKSVAAIPGERPSLLVMVNTEQSYGELMLLIPDGDSVRTEYVAHGPGIAMGVPLTNDTAVFQRIATRYSAEGQLDVVAYATPGVYLFGETVLDTRTLTVRRFSSERLNNLVDRITPLGVSPDEKSFVRIAYDPDSSDLNVFAVTNTATGENYSLPISKQAMHWGEYEDLSPLFVSHYFTWVKDKNGEDRLVAREHVKPLPYRGRLSFNDPDYKEFRIFLATETLRPAVIEWMIKEMGATEADTTGDYSHSVSIGGQKVYISWSTDDKHVGLWVDRGTDVSIIPKLADRLNAALATGQFDKHFVSAN